MSHLQTNWPYKFSSSPADLRELKKNAWIKKGILGIERNDPSLTWDQIFMIDKLGESLYGPRKSNPSAAPIKRNAGVRQGNV